VTWCTCANSPEPYIQLLRASLFPASFVQPETVFTFDVLDHFRIDALECKTAAMNFMSKIVRISNEAFPSEVPVRIPIESVKLPI
jgi:CxC2 like cysteine cluster associated with KDZ transposases